MTQNSYNEVVNITYNIEQAEAAVDKLLAKVVDFDTKMAPLGLSAGRNFSRGFSQGMEGAFGTVDRLEARLRDIIRMQGQVSNTPTPPSVFGDYGIQSSTSRSTPSSSYNPNYDIYGRSAYRDERFDQYGQFNNTYRPPQRDSYQGQRYDEYGQPRGLFRDFPQGIQGGSGLMRPQFNTSSDVFGVGNSSGVTKAIEQLQASSRALMVVAQSDIFTNTNSTGFGRQPQPDMSGLPDFLRLIDQYKNAGTTTAVGPALPPVIHLPASTQVEIFRGLTAGSGAIEQLAAASRSLVVTTDLLRGTSQGQRPPSTGHGNEWWTSSPAYAGIYGTSTYEQGLNPLWSPLQSNISRMRADPNLIGSAATDRFSHGTNYFFGEQEFLRENMGQSSGLTAGAFARLENNYRGFLSDALNRPTGEIGAGFGYTRGIASSAIPMGGGGMGLLAGGGAIAPSFSQLPPVANSTWSVLPQRQIAGWQSGGQVPLPPSGPINWGAGGFPGQGGFPRWPPPPPTTPPPTPPPPPANPFPSVPGGMANPAGQAFPGQVVGNSFGQFGRHAAWMAQTVVLGAAFAVAAASAKELADEIIRLDTVANRLNFINGTTRAQTAGQFMDAARMGIAPQYAATGLVTAAQTGAPAQDNRNAQQLAAVFGADQYALTLAELYQTQQRADSAGIAHVDTMNFIATAYTVADATLGQYFDSLQLGIEMSDKLGLSAEQAGLAILSMSEALDEDPAGAATLLQVIDRRIKTLSAVREGLAAEGITGPAPADYIRQISEMAATGDPEQAERVIQLVVGGQNAAERLSKMRTALAEYYEFLSTPPEMTLWATFWDSFSETAQQRINVLVASFQSMVLGFADTPEIKGPGGYIGEALDDTARAFRNAPVVFKGLRDIDTQPQQAQFYQNARQGFGEEFERNPLNVTNPLFWINVIAAGVKASGIQGRETNAARLGDATRPDGTVVDRRFNPVGGPIPVDQLSELPQGASFEKFMIAALEANKRLSEIPGYQQNVQTVAVLDRGKLLGDEDDRYRIVRLDAKAIQDAIEKVAEEIEDIGKRRIKGVKKDKAEFGGFDVLPEGMDWGQFVAGVRENEQILATQVPNYKQDPKQIAFWDETTNSYRLLVADSEAIRRELSEQTKLMNQQITGVFNVPMGGDAQVSFSALQQGLIQAGTEDGTSGGSAMDASSFNKVADDFGSSAGKYSSATAKFDMSVGRFGNFLDKFLYHNQDTPMGRPGVPKGTGASAPGPMLNKRQPGAGKNDYMDDIMAFMQMMQDTDNSKSIPGSGKSMQGAPKAVGQQAVVVNNVINLRNQVILNGRIISDQILREFQRQLRGNARASGTGGRTNLGV